MKPNVFDVRDVPSESSAFGVEKRIGEGTGFKSVTDVAVSAIVRHTPQGKQPPTPPVGAENQCRVRNYRLALTTIVHWPNEMARGTVAS